jgi:hypothetical protein
MPCEGSPAPPATKAVAIGPKAMPAAQKASARSAAAVPSQAAAEPAATVSAKAAEPAPAEPAAAAATTPPAPVAPPSPAPAPPQTAAASSTESDRLVIRFDDKVAALTPSGIRAFNEAVAAAKSGKSVQLTIEGCDANADFSRGSACAKRLYSLENRLAETGIKNPKRLFVDIP